MLTEIRLTQPLKPRLHQLEERIAPASLQAGFSESVFATGLTTPTAMEFAPDGRLFVTEKAGTLRVIQNGNLLATPFLTVGVTSDSERGLLSVVFDPNFAGNRFLYVYYTTNAATPVNRVSRFTADAGNPNVALAGSEVVILDNIAATNGNHNGGAMHFGTDGMLYVGVGDAGTSSNSQSLASLNGKILRLNTANPGNPIPGDNPFVGVGGARGEIWALGFRNPFTFNVQPGTGRIFVNDVGSTVFEEINDLMRGGNYGWPNAEGPDGGNVNFIDPIYFYPRDVGRSIAGGTFYQANAFPSSFQNSYFFSDFVTGIIQRLPNASAPAAAFATGAQGPVDLDVGPDGNLYYLELFTGQVKRVVANSSFVGEPITAVAVDAGGGPHVLVYNRDGSLRFSFFAYAAGFRGGVHVATGDVTGDGVPDIITGVASGAPHVKVFDGVSGAEIASFFAFAPSFAGGVFVAAGDVNGDGRADIIVGAGSGGGPHVRVFDGSTFAEIRSFFAYASSATFGVRVAAGNFNGDAADDIVTGAGPGGGPHVKVFDGRSLAELASYFAYDPAYTGGVFVAAGDINGDGRDDVVTGSGLGASHVRVFSGISPASTMLASFIVVNPPSAGIRVTAKDLDGDGRDDVVTGPAAGATPTVSVYSGSNLAVGNLSPIRIFNAFDPSFLGGIFVG